MRYSKQIDGSYTPDPGHEALWNYFGLSRAAWLTLPRALMHEMPDEWQAQMAALLLQWDASWGNVPDEFSVGVEVRAHRGGGRLVPMPEILGNYRHPDSDTLRSWMTPAPDRQEAA